MSIVKPNSNIVKTDYDRTDLVLTNCHQVSFDLQDLVQIVEEQANKGLSGTALSIPPLRIRQLCGDEKQHTASGASLSAYDIAKIQKEQQQQHQQQGSSANSMLISGKSFSQALWDRGVHLFRLLRHLGKKPTHTIPSINYRPGALLTKIDQYSTELELLLLRSRSGKGSDDELCFQFVRGSCPRGASCSFAHSKLAVSTWSQRWASEHLRDYTHYKSLLKQHLVQTNPDLFVKHHMLMSHHHSVGSSADQNDTNNTNQNNSSNKKKSDAADVNTSLQFSPIAKKGGNNNKNQKTPSSAAEDHQRRLNSFIEQFEVPLHPITSGAMLRFADESIGPEALSIVLDMLKNRDACIEAEMSPKESKLGSVVIRYPIPKQVFDVFCSMIDLNLFTSLQALDFSKCDLGSTIGKTRFGKLGKVLRRSASARGAEHSNRIDVCLGSNSISNISASSFLSGFAPPESPNGNNNDDTSAALQNTSFSSAPASRQHHHHPGLDNASFTNMSFMSANAATSIAKQSTSNKLNHQQDDPSSPSSPAAAAVQQPSNALNSLVDTSLLHNKTNHHHDNSNTTATSTFGDNDHNQSSSSANHPLLSLNLEFNHIGPSQPDFSDFIASLQDCLPRLEKLSLAGNPLVYDGASRLFPSFRLNGPILSAYYQQANGTAGLGNINNNNNNLAAAAAGASSDSGSHSPSGSVTSNPHVHNSPGNCNNNNTTSSVQQQQIAATASSLVSLSPHLLIAQNTAFCALQYLDVSACCLGDRGVNLLCETIKLNGNNMKYLNVGWNGITADGAAPQLADLLRQKNSMLKCLRVDYSPQVGRRGAILFSQAIKENCSIRRLDMKWCGIGDEGALAILDSLGTSRNTSLAIFTLDQQEVDPRTMEALDEKLGMARAGCQEELMIMETEMVW